MREMRERLRSSGASTAGPYGYTLTIWGSGMVCSKELGSPGVLEILLFLAGAVAAFVLVEAIAYGDLRPRTASAPRDVMAIWGSAHLPAAAGAVLLVWLSDQIVTGTLAWPIAGGVATATFLLLNAAQNLAAARVAQRHTNARS